MNMSMKYCIDIVVGREHDAPWSHFWDQYMCYVLIYAYIYEYI